MAVYRGQRITENISRRGLGDEKTDSRDKMGRFDIPYKTKL